MVNQINLKTINSAKSDAKPASTQAAVFLNGECDLPANFFRNHPTYNNFDFFAADGGADIALKYNIVVQLVMGDMDSLSAEGRKKLTGICEFITLSPAKDKSDGELLLEKISKDGYTTIHIFAATGGRIDQTLFNLHLLKQFKNATIITNEEEISYIGRKIFIENKSGCRASIIPLGQGIQNVSTDGFKFELKNTNLEFPSTLTLSNVIISDIAFVVCRKGDLLLVTQRKLKKPERAENPGRCLKLIKGKRNV